MEQQVIFRDYQEEQAADHNDLQAHARQSLDHIVLDAVTASRRYAGFATAKSSQVEVTIAPGRFYEQGGGVFNRASSLVQSLVASLAASSKRIVVLSAYGQENDSDISERDFLTNVETGATEPDSVAMTRSRDAVLSFTAGSESPDPQPPAIPATHVAIAYIVLDTIQIVSVTMLDANAVASTEDLDVRTDNLEDFKAKIGPRVDSLASDIANLANQLKNKGQGRAIIQLYQDVARLKEIAEIPDTSSDYGADRFLTLDESDFNNVAALGYDAKVEEGVRFSDANADEFEIDIFSANDPNAKVSSGLLLPAFDDVTRMSIDTLHSDIGIAQYGFQTIEIVQRQMARQRLRYGSPYSVCTNGAWWQAGTYDPTTNTFSKDGETFEVLDWQNNALVFGNNQHDFIRLRQIWVDTYQEPYWDYVTTDHSIVGALVAQTFLVSNDFWLTKLGFYLTVKAANEAVFLTLCEVVNGVPDLSKAILHQSVSHTDLLVNDWTRVATQPTFLQAGKRYALVIVSNANHKIGLAYGQQYLDGTFFYSTDGAYFQGDLTKDMMLELWSAKFRASQVSIELDAINLDGGIRAIDILASTISPQSTQLIYEVQPGGSGGWVPLTPDDLSAFNATPPLARFRARFVGTRDIMPGLQMTGSRVRVSRPKLAFKHVSTLVTLAAPSNNITVKILLESFDDTPHDFTCGLRVGAANEIADTTETKVVDASEGRIERTYNFALPAPTSTFRIVLTGATNSAGNTYHVAERVHYAE